MQLNKVFIYLSRTILIRRTEHYAKKSRLEYSIINSSISTIIFILTIGIQFISRTIFIRFLGIEYLGLNGLFTNILSMLSLAELGVGTSIIFSLYKPLQQEDTATIKALMHLYKKYTI